MRVYLDHNATTPLHPDVLAAMLPFLGERFGNPSSVHAWGREARHALETARGDVAGALGVAEKDCIVFTGGGTEANNLALTGVLGSRTDRPRHLIVSAVEHHAVLHTADHLERLGCAVTRLSVDREGVLDPDDVRRAIRPDTVLVSLMHANNETGVLLPDRRRCSGVPRAGRPVPHRCDPDFREGTRECRGTGRGPSLRLRTQDPRPQRDRCPLRPTGDGHDPPDPRRMARAGAPRGTENVAGAVGLAVPRRF